MKEKFEISVTSKGQTVIPQKVRKLLNIEKGSKLLLSVKNRKIILRIKPKDPLQELLKLTKGIKISEREFKQMIKESKRSWSKL